MKHRKKHHARPRQPESRPGPAAGTPRPRPWLRPVVAVAAFGLAGVLVFVVLKQLLNPRHSDLVGPALRAGSSPSSNTPLSLGTNITPLAHTTATVTNKDAAAAALNQKGNEQLKAGDFAGAVQSYRAALALTPGDEDFHLNLGIAYAKLGDTTNSEAQYLEALRLLPDYPEAHNNLGNLYLRSGRLTDAEREFTEAINQMPEYAQAHNNLGIVFQRQKRNNEALGAFQKAVQCESNYWEAHFNLAGAWFQEKEVEKTVAELRETLRINPGFQPAQRLLSQLSGN